MKEGADKLGWSLPHDRPQRRPEQRYDSETRRPTSASATRAAPSSRPPRPTCRTRVEHGAECSSRAASPSACSTRERARGRRRGHVDRRRDGRRAQLTVRAPQVVVACGALESPALLLRSRHRRPGGRRLPAPAPLHGDARATTTRTSRPGGARRTPASSTSSPTSSDGYGFLLEARAVRDRASPARRCRSPTARRTRAMVALPARRDLHRAAARPRPRARDDRRRRAGRALVLADRRARRAQHAAAALEAQIRLHEAAGAHADRRRSPPGMPTWRWGDDLEAFIARAPARSRCGPAAAGCSPPTRWAPAAWAPTRRRASPDPWGELHDTPGVWIGDASAFPTSSGTNPMITIMALAHRTARGRSPAGRAPRARGRRSGPAVRSPDHPAHQATPKGTTDDHQAEQGIQVRDKLYIGGEWVDSAGAGAIEVVNSTTEEVMGRIPEGTRRGRRPRGRRRARGVRELVADLRSTSAPTGCAAIGAGARRAQRGDRRADRPARSACRSSSSHDDPGRPADDDASRSMPAAGGGDRRGRRRSATR